MLGHAIGSTTLGLLAGLEPDQERAAAAMDALFGRELAQWRYLL
jgi:hypothetical protein